MFVICLLVVLITLLPLFAEAAPSIGASKDDTPTAHQSSGKPPIDPLDPSTYNGDVLNVTKCYCQDRHDEHRKGYYYQYDYYNWHGNRFYQSHRTCDSRKHMNFIGLHWVPQCWGDDGFKEFTLNRKACDTQYSTGFHKFQGRFCYQLQGVGRLPNTNYTVADLYKFDSQTRSIANVRSWLDLDSDICRAHCPQKIRDMVIAEDYEGSKAFTMRGPGDQYVLESRYTSYTDLDDMCVGCRKA